MAKLEPGAKAQTAPLRVLVPAFVTSELKSALMERAINIFAGQ